MKKQNLERFETEEIKKNIFFYVGTTAYQDFNTGIQRVTRNLSNMIGNYFNEYNLFLVIYDASKDDLRLLNDSELNTFCKYNGYNPINNTNSFFEKVKEKGKKITLFIPELFHSNEYNLLDKIIEKSKSIGYQSALVYHDDTMYNNTEMNEKTRKNIFDNFMKVFCKIDIIIPNSHYSKTTYLFHKNRLQINSEQKIEAIPLSGELLNFKRTSTKIFFCDKYIFANISVTKRKNMETLVNAFLFLQEDFPELKLVICGVVYEENKYYQSFKKLLNENIIFCPNKTDEEIEELYKNALFSVYPSIEEGFGLPIYESLWYCTPVICHNATSTLEIANEINSKCVACIDCLDLKALYKQMKVWMNNEYLQNIYKEIQTIKIKNWYQYTGEVLNLFGKNEEITVKKNKSKIIYYYAHHTSHSHSRTGIQIVTIYLAKQLIKKNINIVFVKWDEHKNSLVPCKHLEINHLFNYNETEDLMEYIHYENYEPIHLYNKEISESVFFNCEYTQPNYAKNIDNYLKKYSIKSIFILHDIIPLVLENYSHGKDDFNKYFTNNILTPNKIITVSNKTKIEFFNYCKKEKLLNVIAFLEVKSILLPYQYRNKNRIVRNIINNDKITILLPGTIEPRKQQLLFIKIINRWIQLNPTINIEVITFGHVWYPMEQLNTEIEKSNGKIKYLGVVSNETLFDLYKTASFSCFLSYYEGFGFPISESLWHGTPVLTANFGSMSEIAKYGGCYCMDTTDENEIYKALDTLVKKPEILEKLKKEIEQAPFTTWENYADEIYQEICIL